MPAKPILLLVTSLLLVMMTAFVYWQFADQVRVFLHPVTPVTFEPKFIPWTRMSFGDHNNDGYIETIGTTNDGSGELVQTAVNGIPTGLLNSDDRWEGIRALQADLNQDGREDVIFSPYEGCSTDC